MPSSSLRHIPPDRIDRNPENPRLIFRTEELEALLASLRLYGIQVPITVYQEGERYVLIDGERRWRCALKLNLKTIPAIVNEKPNELNNILLMFNIHALREQWDYLTIATKLPRVMSLFEQEHGRSPNEVELSELTGLTRGQVRRCRLLLGLPPDYQTLLLSELELPKNEQRLSEDFFLEMERALKTVAAWHPEAVPDLDSARSTLLEKYREGTIANITDFRKLRKIATSVGIGVEPKKAASAIKKVLNPSNSVGISDVYAAEFESTVDERRAQQSLDSLLGFLDGLEDDSHLSRSFRKELRRLRDTLNNILGGH